MLKLEHFTYMIEIAKTKSISRAAEKLYVSQPYLSMALKELEQELGVKLFYRSNKGVRLTEAGERFLICAKKIDLTLSEVKNLSQMVKSPGQKRLSVSSIYSFTMLDLFHSFVMDQNVSELEISYEEIPNVNIPDKVFDRVSDIGVIYLVSTTEAQDLQELRDRGLTFRRLCREPLYAVVGSKHPLADRDSLRVAEICNYPMIVEKIKDQSKNNLADNNSFPEIFKKTTKVPVVFDNSRSMMYYLTKSDTCFTVGQKSLNLSNPFVKSDELRYIPVSDAGAFYTTGFIVSAQGAHSDILGSFIEYLFNFFDDYNERQSEIILKR